MLKIGDKVTVQWESFTKKYPTQTFSVIKKDKGIMPMFKREGNCIWFPEGETYAEQWDNASPLYRAIGWGANPGYMYNRMPDKLFLYQIKILNVENILEKLEACIESSDDFIKSVHKPTKTTLLAALRTVTIYLKVIIM